MESSCRVELFDDILRDYCRLSGLYCLFVWVEEATSEKLLSQLPFFQAIYSEENHVHRQSLFDGQLLFFFTTREECVEAYDAIPPAIFAQTFSPDGSLERYNW